MGGFYEVWLKRRVLSQPKGRILSQHKGRILFQESEQSFIYLDKRVDEDHNLVEAGNNSIARIVQ